MTLAIDIPVGTRFGKFTVIERVERPKYLKNKDAYWRCVCDCGKELNIASNSLRKHTRSCGCKKSIGQYQSAINRVIRQYKKHAKDRNLSFSLTKEEFFELTTGSCYYCGTPPNQKCKSECNTGDFIYNGIDRINNNLGYYLGNCVSCCKQCNRAKTDFSVEEFYEWIRKVSENRRNII